MHPADLTPNNLVVGGKGALRYSVDGGVSWQNATLNPGSDLPCNTIVTDFEYLSSNTVWASTADNPAWAPNYLQYVLSCTVENCPPPACSEATVCRGTFVSTNRGQTWTQKWLDQNANASQNCVYSLAAISDTDVYAATKNGIYRTTDGGTSWNQQPIGNGVPNGTQFSDIFYVPGNPPAIYAGAWVETPLSRNGVFKATSLGGTFNKTTGFTLAHPVNAIGVSKGDANYVYAAYANGELYRSTDGGGSALAWGGWNAGASPPAGTHSGYSMLTAAIIPSNGDNEMYAGTICQGGIYKKEADGTWKQQKSILFDPPRPYHHDHLHYTMRIAQHPTNANKAFATSDDFIFCKTAQANMWEVDTPTCQIPLCGGSYCHLHGLAMIETSPPNPQTIVFAGTGHGNWGLGPVSGRLFRSGNGAQSWSQIVDFSSAPFNWPACALNGDDTSPNCTSIMAIAIRPNDPLLILVGTFGHENKPGDTSYGAGRGMYRGKSTDNGASWSFQEINGGLNTTLSKWIGNVVMDNLSPPNAYIATLDGIYRLSNAETGTSWSDITAPNPPHRRFESIAVRPNTAPNLPRLDVGSSEPGPLGALIYRGDFQDPNWGWTTMTPTMASRAWADTFRVRDIQVGTSKAYAVIEGSGIYCLNNP